MVALPGAEGPLAVFLAPGPHQASLRAALGEELPGARLVETSSSADLRVSLEIGTELLLTLRDAAGDTVLARKLELSRGLEPALRLAVLLVRGAVQEAPLALPAVEGGRATVPPADPAVAPAGAAPPTVPAAEPVSAPPPLRPPRVLASPALAVGAGGGLIGARLAFAADAQLVLDRWHLGATLLLDGYLCCTRSSGDVEADVRATLLLAEVGYSVLYAGAWSAGAFAAPGLSLGSATVRGRSPPFAAPGTSSEQHFLAAVLLAGGWAAMDLGLGFALTLRAGACITLNPIEFQLPSGFATASSQPLGTGVFAPYAVVGVAFRTP